MPESVETEEKEAETADNEGKTSKSDMLNLYI